MAKLPWQPIETAPKDGTCIIVKSGVGSVHSVRWSVLSNRYLKTGEGSWYDNKGGWVPSARWWILDEN